MDGTGEARGGLRLRGVVVALAALVLSGGAYLVLSQRTMPGASALRERLRDRGTVPIVSARGADLGRIGAQGAQLVAADRVPGLAAALAGRDPAALAEVLDRSGVDTLLVDGRDPPRGPLTAASPLRARLLAYARVDGLECLYLSPLAAIYVRDLAPPITDPPLRAALARVARELLAGASPPRIGSFPEPARRTGHEVEVMVTLRAHGAARLWRSARGDSIARALITAATAARGRWTERETSLGLLSVVLRTLEVDVSLLERDGEIGDRSPAFLDRVVTAEHGVGYDDRDGWRYVLPELLTASGTHRGAASFQQLFRENDIREGLGRRDLTLFRFAITPIGESPGGSLTYP